MDKRRSEDFKWRHYQGEIIIFETAKQKMRGIEAMYMAFKGQIKGIERGIMAIIKFH